MDSNILLHAHFDKDESEAGVPFFASSADAFQEKVFVGKATQVRWWDEMGWESGDSIVCVTPVTVLFFEAETAVRMVQRIIVTL